jgi:hypothetical protein
MPFLWTIFFFVLVNNLLGLVPLGDLLTLVGINTHETAWLGGTATQNIWVTGVLAVISGLVFNIAAIVRLGPVGFVKHMLGDLPWYMFPIGLLLLGDRGRGAVHHQARRVGHPSLREHDRRARAGRHAADLRRHRGSRRSSGTAAWPRTARSP